MMEEIQNLTLKKPLQRPRLIYDLTLPEMVSQLTEWGQTDFRDRQI